MPARTDCAATISDGLAANSAKGTLCCSIRKMVERISRPSCSARNRSDACMREPHLPAGCAPAGASPPVTGWASLSSPVESQIPKTITTAAPRRIGTVPRRSCARLRRLRGLFTSLSWGVIILSVARQRPRRLQVGLARPRDLVVTPLFADIEGLLFGEPKPNIVLRVPERGRADRARNNSYWQWKIGIPLIKYKFTCGPPPADH